MLKIGLVGVGGISGAHIPAWNAMEDTTLTAEYYGTAEPPVRCGESHLSGLTEPLHFVY